MDSFTQILQLIKSKLGAYIFNTLINGGKMGILKFSVHTLLLVYAIHTYLKSKGWLPKKKVTGQHIFITGSGSGIGRQMAIRFAKLGAKVTIADLNFEGATKVMNEIIALGYPNSAKAYKMDVSNVQNVKQVFAEAKQEFGPVDILINNAGIVSGKKILENSEFMIEKTIAVNVTSHHYTVREVLPDMLQRNKGHIVTIASIAGQIGVCGLVDYCASKFGAVGFDESLRMEMNKLKKNIKTTCICPYFINTGMFDGAKTKIPLLLPILEENWTSQRIVNAILQEEPMLVTPFLLNIAIFIKSFLPVSVTDFIGDVLGANDSMNDFKGRTNKLTSAQ
ncbi:oxidoreductase (short-chain dehydrogenase family) (macronuclear) [Tetrahymena thermophila SB210]|uniref:Short-chain dehydrogenase/reductase 3 n=1 Tax=Tetrahymena thermophila (strain SB210) TaxID=312017 RepID=I7LZR6_TETTS|nr:oxidoreductase (short-chain dehydrogenase family) [Tetrahymena thermophila SB210]EAR84681.1 oxidoreductase (short-chain dehydrogenase family) [Tetrahymena thermophila SB210]|eukprot:XP_001032344.1 oxidoreductase (short-chain dehydrogenase family) [Tetrahymena thermophila SB210]